MRRRKLKMIAATTFDTATNEVLTKSVTSSLAPRHKIIIIKQRHRRPVDMATHRQKDYVNKKSTLQFTLVSNFPAVGSHNSNESKLD